MDALDELARELHNISPPGSRAGVREMVEEGTLIPEVGNLGYDILLGLLPTEGRFAPLASEAGVEAIIREAFVHEHEEAPVLRGIEKDVRKWYIAALKSKKL